MDSTKSQIYSGSHSLLRLRQLHLVSLLIKGVQRVFVSFLFKCFFNFTELFAKFTIQHLHAIDIIITLSSNREKTVYLVMKDIKEVAPDCRTV